MGTYEDMSSATPLSPRRYRRRILGLGALALVVVFAIGAAIFIPVVQNDLEHRVENELVAEGITGVTASFSGQDGTLRCVAPLADPARASRIAEDLWGVRVVELDPSCQSSVGSDVEPDPAPETVVSTSSTSVPESAATTDAQLPDPDPIVAIIGADPLFSQLAKLLDSAGLTSTEFLGGGGPFTVFAPTNAAFDAAFELLGADGFEELTGDPELLQSVLLHHVTEGTITASQLESGTLTMLDGTDIDVEVGAAVGTDPGEVTLTSGTSVAGVDDPPTQFDIEASNGVVHAIDQLLLPADLALSDPNAVTTAASFVGGRMVLTGSVQSEEQRAQLVAAAAELVDPANIDDQLVIDAAAVTAQADVDRLVVLLAAMPPNLVSGNAELVGSDLTLAGVYRDDAANAAITALAGTVDAEPDLTARKVADVDSALALQEELNAFVQANPVLFELNSAALTAESNAVIEQLAARAIALDGIQITVVGYTDTDGDSAANQQLSESRARSVLDALVAQGLTAETLQSAGLGATAPILDAAGVEDKAASRRVEFIVEAG